MEGVAMNALISIRPGKRLTSREALELYTSLIPDVLVSEHQWGVRLRDRRNMALRVIVWIGLIAAIGCLICSVVLSMPVLLLGFVVSLLVVVATFIHIREWQSCTFATWMYRYNGKNDVPPMPGALSDRVRLMQAVLPNFDFFVEYYGPDPFVYAKEPAGDRRYYIGAWGTGNPKLDMQ